MSKDRDRRFAPPQAPAAMAAHVQRAVNGAMQPKATEPAGRGVAAHVQRAVAGAMQPKAAAPAPRAATAHVQPAAAGPNAARRMEPGVPGPRPVQPARTAAPSPARAAGERRPAVPAPPVPAPRGAGIQAKPGLGKPGTRGVAPPPRTAPPARPGALQARLVIGDRGYLRSRPVKNLLAEDEDIGWDDRWNEAVEHILSSPQVYEFADKKRFETFLVNVTLPMASLDQPKKEEDPFGAKMCYAYSAMCAVEIAGTPVTANFSTVYSQLQFGGGGGANTAFRALGLKPLKDVVLWNTDSDGNLTSRFAGAIGEANRTVDQAFAAGLPIALGVLWSKGPSSGKHWVYVVGTSGQRYLHIRDQQNGHIPGTIDRATWEGASLDGAWTYTVTKVASAAPP